MSEDVAGPTVLSGSFLDRIGLDPASGLLGSSDPDEGCTCTLAVDDRMLTVDANGCDGDLATAADCRETVVERLTARDVEAIHVRSNGLEYRYGDRAVSLLNAAGRFAESVAGRDDRLAATAARDPLDAARELRTRADAVADIGVESGLVGAADGVEDRSAVLTPTVGLRIANYYLRREVPDDAGLEDVVSLSTGSEARIYTRSDSVPLYVLDVVDTDLSATELEVLVEAYEAIADGLVEGDRLASRAVERVSSGSVDPRLAAVLRKHTSGYGVLEDLFADPRVTDVFVTSPVSRNCLRVVADGRSMATNVSLTRGGAETFASRLRRTSGRAFSRASPTVDATASLQNRTELRVAGVNAPVSDGVAFAFREQADDRFTLPALVANDTMPPEAAAFLSVAIERNAAALIAGTRGAGKTTLLGTLLYELAPDTRTVVIEDTPELPVGPLQSVDRDVQALRTGTGEGPEITPADALRTALRLGDGALVVGEIRGEEARVLYEAMRVGANANAVLGTIHGDGAAEVYERVVSDLGVPPSSFGATDLVVTVQAYSASQGRKRRLAAVEEVIAGDGEIRFEPLYRIEGDRAVPTGRIDRGESRFVDRLTGPDEAYADIRASIAERTELIDRLVSDGRTEPAAVAAAYASRGSE